MYLYVNACRTIKIQIPRAAPIWFNSLSMQIFFKIPTVCNNVYVNPTQRLTLNYLDYSSCVLDRHSFQYIYNGIISPSLNRAKIFNSFFDNLCHQVVPSSWANHTCSDLKGGGANPVPYNAKVNVLFL